MQMMYYIDANDTIPNLPSRLGFGFPKIDQNISDGRRAKTCTSEIIMIIKWTNFNTGSIHLFYDPNPFYEIFLTHMTH